MRNFASISRSRFALVAFLTAFVCVSTVGCGAVVERAQHRAAIEKVHSQLVVYTDRLAAQCKAQLSAETTDPMQIFRENEKIYVECRDAMRQLDASACPADYQTALQDAFDSLDAFCAYLGKITSGETEIDSSTAPEIQRLSTEFTNRLIRLRNVAAQYCGQ